MKPVVHIILNSHLDPVWLWKQEQGIDEVLSTARTACDLLDAYPDIHLTRGEAWFYETVERHDPATFARLRGHIAAGLRHGLIDLLGDSAAEEAAVDLRRKRAAAPDGNAHAQHRADQLGQSGQKALLPAIDGGKGENNKENHIIDKCSRK